MKQTHVTTRVQLGTYENMNTDSFGEFLEHFFLATVVAVIEMAHWILYALVGLRQNQSLDRQWHVALLQLLLRLGH